MALQFISRGSAVPRNVPNVFFCAHPEDREKYLQPTAELLLKNRPCVVWYNASEDGQMTPSDVETLVSDMHLLVVAVTHRFLLPDNPACIDFQRAVEHHIPVLPLLFEPGIEGEFNSAFGNLQCLTPDSTDGTAEPFPAKLERYLSSVFAKDSSVERIRSAFDAYVFLSYRKKDRRYAKELMSLIHRCPVCRDIAIWYDEYLTPGEDFNESIAAALEKSSLFALAVTPSILEKDNYVMTEEYPLARRLKKAVFPVELQRTNHHALKRSYQDLPQLIDPDSKHSFENALSKQIRRLAVLGNDNSPEHLLLIGLAYLSGIDVEVDRSRAAELIGQAADAGLPEAIAKIADLYQYGVGLPADVDLAIGYRTLLHGQLYARLVALSADEMHLLLQNAAALFDMYYTDVTRYADDARACVHEILYALEISRTRFGGAMDEAEAYWFTVIGGNSVFGDQLGIEPQKRLEYFFAAAERYRALLTEADDLRPEAAYCYSTLSNTCYLYDEFEKGLRYAEDAIALYTELSAEDACLYLPELARCYELVHVCCVATDDSARAESSAKKNVELLRKHLQAYGPEQIRYRLADAYSYLSDYYDFNGRRDESIALYKQGVEELEALPDDSCGGLLAEMKRSYGLLLEADDREAAVELFEELAENFVEESAEKSVGDSCIRTEVVAGPVTEEHARELFELGQSYCSSNNFGSAERAYLDALAIIRKVTEKSLGYSMLGVYMFVNAETHIDICDALSDLCVERGRFDEAVAYALESLRMQESILGVDPSERSGLTLRYNQLGYVCYKKGDYDQAVDHYLKVLNMELEENDYEAVGTCVSIAEVYAAAGRLGEAESYYEQALALEPTLDLNYMVTVMIAKRLYSSMADFYEKNGETDRAKRYAARAAELNKRLDRWR